jgi:cytochrome oxidase assembly protein ShyY1
VFRLALTPRWLGYLALTVVFSIVAAFFGLWQWDRREQAVAIIEKVDLNYDLAPVPVGPFLEKPGGFMEADEWKPVVVSGYYLAEEQILVRTRPRSGQVGFEVLVPLKISEELSIVIARGWVPTGETRDFPDEIPPPPPGEVTVVGRMKPPEPQLPGRGAPEGQLPSIDLLTYQGLTQSTLETRFYLERARETPQAPRIPVSAIKPVPNEGPHLSYTLQWFVFIGLAVGAYLWLLRNEYRTVAGMLPARSQRRSDADEEDALMESDNRIG